jgi:DnaJ family protein C protein 9
LLAAYTKGRGKWSVIYELVMLSDIFEDEARYRQIIDAAIDSGEVKPYKTYTEETKVQKDRRVKAAQKETDEAVEYAKELGVKDKLFGQKGESKGEDSLAALIQSRNAGSTFLDQLEAKYGAKEKSKDKKGKKRAKTAVEDFPDMPTEEEFQAAAAKLAAKNSGESKAKKAKKQ